MKNYNSAIADYSKAIELNPKYAAAYKHRGDVKFQLKKYQEALTDYDHVIEIAPNFPEAKESKIKTEEILNSDRK